LLEKYLGFKCAFGRIKCSDWVSHGTSKMGIPLPLIL
jgi:hypothetical protein